MCYSAMVEQDLKKYGIRKGDWVDVARFRDLIHRRTMGENLYIPKAMEANFVDHAKTPEETEVKGLILDYREAKISSEQTKLFVFKKRMADAERKLKIKVTKGGQKEMEVCERQIHKTKYKLEKLNSKEITDGDSRIFPMGWAPMMIMNDGVRVLVPTRYHMRPQGQPESFDKEYNGNYNARRENLGRVEWWKKTFGKQHGIMVVNKFFENVPKHLFEKRDLRKGEEEENVVIEFTPSNDKPMYVAVLYDTWPNLNKIEFYSAAAITMDPPPEVAETGHQRCIIPISAELVDSWLTPGKPLEEYQVILDKREMPFYKHKVAA